MISRAHRTVAASVFGIILVIAGPLGAQAPDVTGHWEGQITIPGRALGFNVDLAMKDGSLAGDISIPAQNTQDFALTDVKLEGRTLSFRMAGVPGDPTFEGTVAADGQKVEGTFKQGQGSFPFSMSRGGDPAALTTQALEGFDAWIADAMEKWVVPGMAVGIIRDGRVVYTKGFGKRDIANDLPVTPQTLFAIGSATKAFTAFDVGVLVDEGKVDLDTPVREYLPGFELKDPVATLELTPRDMMSHRSGLPRHDMAWYNNPDLTPAELFKRLRYFAPNKELRETWQYNNMMFVTAGYLVSQVSGESWKAFTREHILDPLGMGATDFSVTVSQEAPDHALPYGEEDGNAKPIPFRDIDNVGPAGSINSNVEDMAKWVTLQLSNGTWQGKRLVKKATLDAMHTPQMVIAAMPTDSMIGPRSYGLAWFVDTYRGHFRVSHGGNIDGFSALVALYPQERIGMVVLSNKNGSPMPEYAVRQISDRLFGLEPRDWSGEGLARQAKSRAAQEASKAEEEAERVKGTHPSRPLEDYLGKYEDPGYGTIEITGGKEGLAVHYNGMSAPLEHWHYDVFRAGKNDSDPALEGTKVQFVGALDGSIEGLKVPIEPTEEPLEFERGPDPKLSDPAYLAGLVGRYELADGTAVTVTISGTSLTITLAGQPPYAVIPQHNDTFALKGRETYKARFTVVDGRATAVTFIQPNGVFKAPRVEGGD